MTTFPIYILTSCKVLVLVEETKVVVKAPQGTRHSYFFCCCASISPQSDSDTDWCLPAKMKRSVASGWNFLLSLEDESAEAPSATGPGGIPGGHHLSIPEASPVDAEELLHLNDGAKLVICTTGLPGRGKTHIAGKIMRYISWLGYKGRHFEVAQHLREKLTSKSVNVRTFYEANNVEAQAARHEASERGMAEMCDWLRQGGQVALLDATHGSLAKRERVRFVSFVSLFVCLGLLLCLFV
jgi:adenylylsulfate kinase-like enzyme